MVIICRIINNTALLSKDNADNNSILQLNGKQSIYPEGDLQTAEMNQLNAVRATVSNSEEQSLSL